MARGQRGSTPEIGDQALAERVKAVLALIGNDETAAKISGLSVDTLANYEKARIKSPNFLALYKLARAVDVSIEWLVSGEGPQFKPRQIQASYVAEEPQSSYVAIAQQDGRIGAKLVEYLRFRPEWLWRLGLTENEVVLIEASGDAMGETIRGGDLLLVDVSNPQFHGDGLYVMSIDDALAVRRVGLGLAGQLVISSDNPKYPDRLEVPRDVTQQHLRFVGRVVWKGGEV